MGYYYYYYYSPSKELIIYFPGGLYDGLIAWPHLMIMMMGY